jgi:uncharacterized membrane protein required for colicin V production
MSNTENRGRWSEYLRTKLVHIFPEVEEYSKTTQFTATLLIIDIMLLPIYITSPAIYLISILIHVYLAGGIDKIFGATVELVIKVIGDEPDSTD